MTNEELQLAQDILRLETAQFLIRECESFDAYPLAAHVKLALSDLKAKVVLKQPRKDRGTTRNTDQETLPGVTK